MKKIIVFLLIVIFLFNGRVLGQEITFWQFWSDEWLAPVVKEFEQKNPGVTVNIERLTWADGFNKIITAMAANQAPDVIEIGSTWVASMSEDGGLQPLQVGQLRQQLANWEPAYYQGNYYAIPWTLSTASLYINTDLQKKAGFEKPPQDWNELLQQVKAIHALGKTTYGYGVKTGTYTTWQKFLPFAWSNDSRIINSDWKTTGVNTKQFKQAVSFYKELKHYGLFDENTVVRKAFQEGKVGFMIEEPGQIKKFRQETPQLNFDVVKLPQSPYTKKSINFAGAQMLAVTKNTKDKALAEKLIKFLVQIENTKAITSRITTLFPSDKRSLNDDFYQKEHPELLVFLETLKTATSPQAHPRWIDIQEIFTQKLETILFERASVDEAMEEAADDIQDILKEYNEE